MNGSRRDERMRSVLARRRRGAVVLEDVRDPWNAAAVFRTCDALGFARVHAVFDRVPPYSAAERVGAGATAERWVDLTAHDSVEDCYARLRADNYVIWATTCDGEDAVSLREARFDGAADVAIVLGNERNGLSRAALELADHRLHVPMEGMVQSLNISVTAALCLWEIDRQTREGGRDVGLDAEASAALLDRWQARDEQLWLERAQRRRVRQQERRAGRSLRNIKNSNIQNRGRKK